MRNSPKIFEWILWKSRIMIILPVIGGIISALIMVLIGVYDIVNSILQLPTILDPQHMEESTTIILHVISALDAFLIATVLLIFSIGLYELFISPLSFAEKDERSSQILVIHNLDELKEKVAKVIIMVLIVTFFQESISFKYHSVLELLEFALAIFLVSLAVYFTHKKELLKKIVKQQKMLAAEKKKLIAE